MDSVTVDVLLELLYALEPLWTADQVSLAVGRCRVRRRLPFIATVLPPTGHQDTTQAPIVHLTEAYSLHSNVNMKRSLWNRLSKYKFKSSCDMNFGVPGGHGAPQLLQVYV